LIRDETVGQAVWTIPVSGGPSDTTQRDEHHGAHDNRVPDSTRSRARALRSFELVMRAFKLLSSSIDVPPPARLRKVLRR
jgi:hypothetical protein